MPTPSFNISDLPVCDDLNIPVDPDTYQDQANPAPMAPGNYRAVITKFSARKDTAGVLVLADGKFPTIIVEQIKIIEPVENARLVGVFSDVRFKPFERRGATGAAMVASELYDLLRAYDETMRIDNYEHAKELLAQYLGQELPVLLQIKWEGYDKTYVDTQFAACGMPRANVAKDVQKRIYDVGRKLSKDFVVGGVRQASILGASGEVVEARAKIGRYFPSGTELGTGTDAKNRKRIELGAFAK